MNLLSLTEELRIIFNSPVNKRFFPEKSIIKYLMRVGLITSTVLIITSAQLLFARSGQKPVNKRGNGYSRSKK